MFTKVDSIEPHGVYYHGCLKDFCEITKWNGNEVGTYFFKTLYKLHGSQK